MDEAQHFSNLCTYKKEYGVVEHLDACDVRRGGRKGKRRQRERGKGRVEEDKWVRSVRVRRGVGKGRESGGRVPEKRERKKREVQWNLSKMITV